jgi:hypothetical protein
MDLRPRALARWLPSLAVILGIEGIVALVLLFMSFELYRWTCLGALAHVPQVALLLGFAIAVPVMTSGGPTRITCQRLLYGGYLCITATALGRFVDVTVTSEVDRPWLLLQAGASVLVSSAAPGIWGTALAWEEDLSSVRIARCARIAAGLSLTGFALYFVSELRVALLLGPVKMIPRESAALVLSSLILFAGRILLLWCSIDLWRRESEEAPIRDRARRIQRLMAASTAISWGSALFTIKFWDVESHGAGGWFQNEAMLLWNAFVHVTLTLLVAILVSLALENETLSYNPRKKGPVFPDPPPRPPEDLGPIDLP